MIRETRDLFPETMKETGAEMYTMSREITAESREVLKDDKREQEIRPEIFMLYLQR